jgi:hypothetical protein
MGTAVATAMSMSSEDILRDIIELLSFQRISPFFTTNLPKRKAHAKERGLVCEDYIR